MFGVINVHLGMLSKYGIVVEASEDLRHFKIKGKQKYKLKKQKKLES
jgi:hypothetical protein